MDGTRHNQARENQINGSFAMDFSSTFRRSKRSRIEDRSDSEEKESSVVMSEISEPLSRNSLCTNMSSTWTAESSTNPWRLPCDQTLVASQQYLNEQLQHVVVLSSVLSSGPENGTRKVLRNEDIDRDDVENVCTLDLSKIWNLLDVGAETQTQQQKTAERGLRNVLDLVNYLLYEREREIGHQNQLSEKLTKAEKQLERMKQIVRTLKSDLETAEQNSAQKENIFKAKEQALVTKKKTLLVEKKALEVHYARMSTFQLIAATIRRLQGVEAAYKAQLRRKDVDYARLRKSLQDVVARATKEKRGVVIEKPLNSVRERKKILINSESNESKLTKEIMENLERKRAELLFDNEALAKSYDTLQHHLESLTSHYKKTVRLFLAQKNLEGDAKELEEMASTPIDSFTPMPFNMASKEGIPQYISKSMEALSEKLRKLEDVISNELPSAEYRQDKEIIKRLRQKLEEAHGIIQEQDQLLQASLSAPVAAVRAGHQTRGRNVCIVGPRGSPDARAEEDMAHEKIELAMLRQNLQKERKLLHERAIKLDKDRIEFEISKRDQIFDRFEGKLSSTSDYASPQRNRLRRLLDSEELLSSVDSSVSGTYSISYRWHSNGG
ncbi:hypothetical protein PsorP6_002759 [Peronosclerospora sorghi]|uniref:Uncharacterized protein n=1 Tax=Peronosclerospora sorghi TaxID=230839 RepID=A0ACC0VI70_9STRA|nr:hypothetical protein PsorP6_002759 [Peronosclerospora sorghi]